MNAYAGGCYLRYREFPRRTLLGNLGVSGHKKRPESCGLQPFSILLYSVRYRLPLIVRVISEGYYEVPFSETWCPFLGKWGKGKEAGTRVLAVFLQHICSKVNTQKGAGPSFWVPLCSQLPRRLIPGNPEGERARSRGPGQETPIPSPMSILSALLFLPSESPLPMGRGSRCSRCSSLGAWVSCRAS